MNLKKMNKNKQIHLAKFFIFFIILLASFAFSRLSFAASMSLFANSGTIPMGQNFSVVVSATSIEQSMNAVLGTITFPKDKIQVNSLSREGTIMNIWTAEPSFSNQNGTINFEGILWNPGFTGSGGKVITINFVAKSAGSAQIKFSSGAVLANDGNGTDITSSAFKAGTDPKASVVFQIGNSQGTPTPVVVTGVGAPAPKYSGIIFLQVEAHGEAWYIEPKTALRYYMSDGPTAYSMMRNFGEGITTANLNKIPIGINSKSNELDSDSDGASDNLEQAIGTNPNNPDTDGDGQSDGVEISNGNNYLGSGVIKMDSKIADRMKGKILLQVEARGEAWYINPKDGKRYYMKDGAAAYEIMRYFGQGIKNSDLEKIAIGLIN